MIVARKTRNQWENSEFSFVLCLL